MPLADFACLVCRVTQYDVIVDRLPASRACPDCGSPMRRPIRPPAIRIGSAYRRRHEHPQWSDYRDQLATGDVQATAEAHYDMARRSGIGAQRAREIVADSAVEGVQVTARQARALEDS